MSLPKVFPDEKLFGRHFFRQIFFVQNFFVWELFRAKFVRPNFFVDRPNALDERTKSLLKVEWCPAVIKLLQRIQNRRGHMFRVFQISKNAHKCSKTSNMPTIH